MVDIGVFGGGYKTQVGAAGEEPFECDLEFEPCQWGTDAEVDAAAEAGVLLDGACGIEPRGIGVGRWVVVCGTEHAADFVAALERMPTKVDVFIDVPHEEMQGRIETQEFFDAFIGDVAVTGFQQCFGAVANRVHRGLVPCVKE